MKMRIRFTTAAVIALLAMVQKSDSAGWNYEKVESVDTAESIIKITGGSSHRRMTVTSSTFITVNNKPGKLEDITPGMWVEKITCTSGNLAGQIKVIDPRIEKTTGMSSSLTPSSFSTNSSSVAIKATRYNKVESVDAGNSTITITEMDGITRTFGVTSITQITVYGNSGKLEDIKSGMKVDFSATVGRTAGRIDAMDPPTENRQTAINNARSRGNNRFQRVPPPDFNLYEKVLSVSPAEFSMTVIRADGQNRRTIIVSAFTKITVHERPGKLEDIKSDMKVDIVCNNGNLASRIDAMDPPPEKRK